VGLLSAGVPVFVCMCSHGGSEESSLGIDHAEEMELLLENYFMQAEELGNKARELKDLIDDSESVIFINLDRYSSGNLIFYNAFFSCSRALPHDAIHIKTQYTFRHCSILPYFSSIFQTCRK